MNARARGGAAARRAVPLTYIGTAMVLAAMLLPSALRPPPDQANQSAALSPDAPPEEQAEQIIQSVQQAEGGGAGAAEGEGAAAPTTTTSLAPASGECVGGRQNFSVYANECAPAWSGDNGGATYKNVFPDEIRIGFWHGFGGPDPGRLPDTPQPGESAGNRTFRVWQTWFNEHFNLYGRKIVFYGLEDSDSVEEDQARVATAVNEYKLFALSHVWTPVCTDFARHELPMWCVSAPHDTFAANDGFVFSYPDEITKSQRMGAEYVCKTLAGKPATFSPGNEDKPRKIGFVTNLHARAGAPMKDYVEAHEQWCGEPPEASYQFGGDGDEGAEQVAAYEMYRAGVTTVVSTSELGQTLYLMQAADAIGWNPEWVFLANWGHDTNAVGKILTGVSPNQASRMIAMSGWELPQRPDQTECYRAYHEIDPDTDPAPLYCAFWQQLILMVAGLQGAGPNLTADTYRQGLYELGYRCGVAAWMTCGGFGPNDNSYMDDYSQVWFDPSAIAPDDGAPGAWRYTHGGRRFRAGAWDGDGSELFAGGITSPPG